MMAWKSCLSRSDLLALTWDEINLHEGLIELVSYNSIPRHLDNGFSRKPNVRELRRHRN
jgi:hypothetical protein